MADIVPIQHLSVTQGYDWDDIIDFVFASGDLTGAKLWLTVKRYPTDADGAALVQISSPTSGVTILTSTSARFQISRTVLAAVPAGTYHYDVRVAFASGNQKPALRGRFEVAPMITHSMA